MELPGKRLQTLSPHAEGCGASSQEWRGAERSHAGHALGLGAEQLGWREARAAFRDKKQWDADIRIGNGAGHEVTPMMQKWEGVYRGTCRVHRGRKLAGLP